MNSPVRSASSEPNSANSSVNYDSPALVEVEVDDQDFRIDAGKQGTALCISQRVSGSWDWSYCGEAKWDGSSLRCKALERPVLMALSKALAEALANQA